MPLTSNEYPMIEVDEAIKTVLSEVVSLSNKPVNLSQCCGRIIGEDIISISPFPSFLTSIMDGYAVKGPLSAGTYPVQEKVLAGSSSCGALHSGKIVYITTGSQVPPGANAVVKVEDTVVASQEDGVTYVTIKCDVQEGANIRQIGSDISPGQLIVPSGSTIGPAEVGLLATIGIAEVPCTSNPVVGVMSTGDELVEPWETPTGAQIRDSNRPALIAAFRQGGCDCVDLGIIRDSKETLRERMLSAAEQCDIVITSGGVSMGEADFVKVLLQEIGTVHFGRMRMMPGKPTTFASVPRPSGKGTAYFFGLPGNPVSCLVTKALVVDPALKRLQGMKSSDCMHPQVKLRTTESYKLNSVRPEYHRAYVKFDSATQTFRAQSTGMQRSSRLLSMRTANALLCLPRGEGLLPIGSVVSALLVGDIPPPSADECHHSAASGLDVYAEAEKKAQEINSTKAAAKPPGSALEITVGLLTISDRAHQGVYRDESGPEMEKLLKDMSDDPAWPVSIRVACTAVVPDERADITAMVTKWSERGQNPVHLILSSGGTGFGPRDITPEAIRPLLHREAPSVAQALINEGLRHTPLAVLSRPVVGTRFETLICTLPGSVKAIRENLVALKPLLPRIMNLITTGECSVRHEGH